MPVRIEFVPELPFEQLLDWARLRTMTFAEVESMPDQDRATAVPGSPTPDERAARAAYQSMLRCQMHSPVTDGRVADEIARGDHDWEKQTPALRAEWVAAIRAAVAEEREACAKVADEVGRPYASAAFPDFDGGFASACEDVAAAIRART